MESHLQERLSAYVSDEVSEQERREIEDHLSRCPECMEKLSRLQKLDALFDRMDELEPGPGFLKQILAKVEQERNILVFRARRRVAILLAAAVVVFFVFLLSLQKEYSPPVPVVKEKPVESIQPKQPEPDIVRPTPVQPATVAAEMIIHLEALENMEFIQELQNLNHLDLAMMMAETEDEQ